MYMNYDGKHGKYGDTWVRSRLAKLGDFCQSTQPIAAVMVL
ncbi:hypothetical protein [Microcoleus sp. B3-A4]